MENEMMDLVPLITTIGLTLLLSILAIFCLRISLPILQKKQIVVMYSKSIYLWDLLCWSILFALALLRLFIIKQFAINSIGGIVLFSVIWFVIFYRLLTIKKFVIFGIKTQDLHNSIISIMEKNSIPYEIKGENIIIPNLRNIIKISQDKIFMNVSLKSSNPNHMNSLNKIVQEIPAVLQEKAVKLKKSTAIFYFIYAMLFLVILFSYLIITYF